MKSAAERLLLTQPAISKTLKELETLLGADLMTRSRAGISLTKQGEVFLHFAEMSLAALQQGMDGVEREGEARSARVKVGVLPSVAARLMPLVAQEFSELSNSSRLEISDGPVSYLIQKLRNGELDLVVGRQAPPDTMKGIAFTQLYNETVDFVVRPKHPLLQAPDLARIGEWQVIYPSEHSAIRPLVERYLIANGVGELPNKLETVSGAFGRVYTPRSDAVWIISSGVVANEIDNGMLCRLPFDTTMTNGPVGLMMKASTNPSSEQKIFSIAVDNIVRSQGL
ncbi:pca operon transcription factor PcaQ [Cognatishimia sp. WU-CL00825]